MDHVQLPECRRQLLIVFLMIIRILELNYETRYEADEIQQNCQR